MNDDRTQSNIALDPFDSVVAIDATIAGNLFYGTGIFVGPKHVLTAGHVLFDSGYGLISGARVILPADVASDRGTGLASNVSGAPLFPKAWNTSPAPANDIAMITLTGNLTPGNNALGMVVFLDAEDLVGRAITTAGYPATSNSPDPSGKTQYQATGTVYSVAGGGLLGDPVWMTYSESVDTQGGQSGSGVWLSGDFFGESVPLVAAVHVRGNNDVSQITDGTGQGTLISKAIYDKLTAQMIADGGSASVLPESAIVGTNPGFFSPVTGSGDDYIQGSKLRERIIGQGGDDRIAGGGGNDRLEGGDGVDQALFSGTLTEYDLAIQSGPIFQFSHMRGTKSDGTDTLKDIEFALFEYGDADNNGTDDDATVFYVPLEIDPTDATKLKDGPDVTYNKDVTKSDGTVIGTVSVDMPAFSFDGDVKFTLNIGSTNSLLYNFSYIVDSSGSMWGTNIEQTVAAYGALSQLLIDNGIAARSQFSVVDFDSTATLYAGLTAQEAADRVASLVASGGTNFGPALALSEQWFESLSNVATATNVAFFLSDGFGSGASDSLQIVREDLAGGVTVDVRAFGIGSGADLGQLNIIDSGDAVLLRNPADLFSAFSVSGVDRSKIDHIDVRFGGKIVDRISPSQLADSTLGLSFEGSIDNLLVSRTADNRVFFDVVFNDGTATTTLETRITTGQQEVRTQTTDGTVLVTLSVNQADYNAAVGSQSIVANSLANTITVNGSTNTVRGEGGDDRFVIKGGINTIDGGDGVDSAVFNVTRAAAGAITRTGNVVSVGDDTSLINVEYLDFTDVRIATATLTPAAVLSLASPSAAIREGDGATAAFVVSLANAMTTDTVVAFTTRDGSAKAGSDYQARSGTATILAGSTSATISIDLLNDSAAEQMEDFYLDLSLDGTARFNDNKVTATAAARIADNDVAISLQLTGNDVLIREGDPGAATTKTISVQRVGDLSATTTVTYAVTPTGSTPASASDFAGGLPSGSITFAAGESVRTFSIAINADTMDEPDRTFALELKSDNRNVTVQAPTVFTIVDDDDDGDNDTTLPGTSGPDQYRLPANGPQPTGIDAFGSNDTLVLGRALADSNRDGLIGFGKDMLLDLPGGGKLDVAGIDPETGLRALGSRNGEFYYAEASVKPKGAIEGTVGNDSLKGTSARDIFFYDTALGIDLGRDIIRDFAAGDRIVTTSAIFDGNGDGRVTFGRDKILDFTNADGSVTNGQVALFGTTGKSIGSLNLIDTMIQNDVTYYVYGLAGDTTPLPASAF